MIIVAVLMALCFNAVRQERLIKTIIQDLELHTANLYHINCAMFPDHTEAKDDK